MTPEQRDAQWVCAYCNHTYVVPSMARRCEARHELEEKEDQDESQS